MFELIKRIVNLFIIESDNEKFDKLLNNKEDVYLFEKTITELNRSDIKTKEITLSNGVKIIVSL